MITHAIRLPQQIMPAIIEHSIDQAIADMALRVTLKATLKQYPGCIHWHVKSDHHIPGTLEITFWPAQRRAWFSVQNGRQAAWIDAAIHELGDALQRQLSRADLPT